MTGEILSRVLPLPEGVVRWRLQDPRAVLPGTLVVAVRVFDTDRHSTASPTSS